MLPSTVSTLTYASVIAVDLVLVVWKSARMMYDGYERRHGKVARDLKQAQAKHGSTVDALKAASTPGTSDGAKEKIDMQSLLLKVKQSEEEIDKIIAARDQEMQHHSKRIQHDAYVVAEIVTEEIIETLLPLLVILLELWIYFLSPSNAAFAKTYMTSESVKNGDLVDGSKFLGV
eukprot:SAG31_NODE_10908_length_1085_cov_1.099391_2_plen_175_part_00